MRGAALALVTLAMLAGCPADGNGSGDGAATTTEVAPGSDTVVGTTAAASGSGSADGASSGPGDASSSGGDTGPTNDGESGIIHFIALGDSGEGNEAQYAVAAAAETVCATEGCDFALLLGDNFYDVGVTSVTDPQFVDKFELVYEGLDIPFYVILGNHDYGTLANDWARGQYQIDYGAVNPKWVMPHFWYSFSSESGDTQFFCMDTQRMMWDHETAEQWAWFDEQMAASTASWKIAFAHHPYISNGEHGNAGNYEGFPGIDFIDGSVVQEFVDSRLCGQVDVYFSGHDHNRQAFDPVCGTYFIVSGAAAKVTDFAFRDDNPTEWGDDTREGFVWVEITGQTFTARFYDFDGNLDHEQTFTR